MIQLISSELLFAYYKVIKYTCNAPLKHTYLYVETNKPNQLFI